MSRTSAIDVAVRLELAKERNTVPQTYQETMGGTYNYNTTTIQGFLMAVSTRLKADSPPWIFDWTQLAPNDCVGYSVMLLEGAIATKTNGGS